MSENTITILVIFILYMLFMVGIGFYFSRKKMSNADYVLGGRSLNPWVTAMSAQASDMSGWLLTGLPGLAYLGMVSVLNTKAAIFTAIGLLLGTLCNWIFVAKRIRVYTEISDNSLTISSYLSNRFKEKGNFLKVITAIVISVFFTIYAASMFSASATLFSTVFNIDYIWALTIGVIVIVVYVMLGGFLAVSWTDMFQGLLMFFALILVPILCYTSLKDGQIANVNGIFTKAFQHSSNGDNLEWTTIVGSLAWGLGYFGMPHILVRFMAIKDFKKVKPACIIAMVWTTITLTASILIGVLGTEICPGLDNSESVFLSVVMKIFHPILAGILLSAVLSAIMSTADSQLLVASSSFSNDIYSQAKMKIAKKDTSDKEKMWVGRLAVLVLSIIAFAIATDQNSSIFELVAYAWGGLGSAFGPVVLFSLYSKKVNKYGAIASILTGVVVSLAFKYGFSRFGGFWAIFELVPGFVMATINLYLVSLLTNKYIAPKDKEEINQEFDSMISTIRKK